MVKLAPALRALPLLFAACAAASARPQPTVPLADADGPWAAADARALAAPPQLARDPAALAAYLTHDARGDAEKARAIFRWIAANIAYDYEAMRSTAPVRPQQVLERRKSICEGYASVFELLGRLAGLRVVTIHGWAKGYDWTPGTHLDRPNHAWNAVLIDGRWKLVDPTWGAGYVRDSGFIKALDDYYFMPSPESLAFTHLAEDPRWQLVARPLPLAAFEAQVVVRSAFFRAGFSAAEAQAALASPVAPALVAVFLAPDQPIRFRSAPAQGVLTAGRTYRFEARAPAGASVAVVNDGRWQYLRPERDALVASVTPQAGVLYVAARTPADARYQTLLQYEAR